MSYESQTDEAPHDDRAQFTLLERRIAKVWAEELTIGAPPGPEDDFFALGGDSVAMMMILFRIEEMFSIELADETLLEAPELRQFCLRVEAAGACAA